MKTTQPSKIKAALSASKQKKTSAVADELGAVYAESNAQAKLYSNKLDKTKTEIKSLTAELGREYGKHRVIEGDRYAIGYTLVENTPSIDIPGLSQALTPQQLAAISVQANDPDKLAAAVQMGVIPKTLLEKHMVTRKATERILVQTIGEWQATKEKGQG